MLKFDAGKLAKDAMEGLKKAESLGDSKAEAAKSILQGVKDAGGLTNLSGKIPEQVLEMLRKLVAEAKQLTGTGGNAALAACVEKAQAVLDGGDASIETATKLAAELGSLIKGAAAETPKRSTGTEDAAQAAAKPSAAPAHGAAASPEAKSEPIRFSDVAEGAYYYDAVQWAVQKGVASGTSESTFSPDQECTRAQTISFLWRADGSPAPKNQTNPFSDVAEGAYYYSAALWAAERGIVSGTKFNPDGAVTRGQLSAFLYRNAGSPAVENKASFTDVPEDSYFCQAVAWVAAQGITSGTGEHTFSPDMTCTRGQIVTFLYRAKK